MIKVKKKNMINKYRLFCFHLDKGDYNGMTAQTKLSKVTIIIWSIAVLFAIVSICSAAVSYTHLTLPTNSRV